MVGEGSNPGDVLLTFSDYNGLVMPGGDTTTTSRSVTLRVSGADFSAENITFQNEAGPTRQAAAVWVYGDRAYFNNCRFLSFHDTLYPYGCGSRQLYQNCYIEGTTTTIIGSSTALFEDCTIFSKPGGSCLMSPSTPDSVTYGFVFQRCNFTGDATPGSYFLARPLKEFAKVVLLNCKLDALIDPRGWDHRNKDSNKPNTFFGEYKSTGPGATPKARASWTRQLTPEQAVFYTRANVLRGWDPTLPAK